MPDNKIPGKTALIVVDAQNGVLEKAFDRNRIIQNIKMLLKKQKRQMFR